MLAPIILAGCGGDGPGGDGATRLLGGERDAVVTASEDGSGTGFEVRTEDGEVRVDAGSGSLPSDFPSAVGVPSEWQVVQSGRITSEDATVWTVTWNTAEGAAASTERFASGLPGDLREIYRTDTETDGVASVLIAWEGSQFSVIASFMDGSAPGEPSLATVTVSDEPAVAAGTATSGDASTGGDQGGGLVGAIGGQEAVDAFAELGIGAKAEGMAFALGGRYELVDDTTVRLILDDKTLDDQLFDCIVVGAILDPGETVIVVYPDGQATC